MYTDACGAMWDTACRAQDLKTNHTKGCHSKPQSLANGTRTARTAKRLKLKKLQNREAVEI